MGPRSVSLLCVMLLSVALVHAATPGESRGSGLSTHVVTLSLLVAGNESSGGGEPLPARVAKAVQDIKEFLPYARYQLHDTMVVRAAAHGPVRADLEGPDGRYAVQFQYQMADDPGRINVYKFEMVRAFDLAAPPAGKENGDAPTPKASPRREVISTSFSVSVGETIVVGTSRLNGAGKALVLVLSVLPDR